MESDNKTWDTDVPGPGASVVHLSAVDQNIDDQPSMSDGRFLNVWEH